MLKKNNAHHIQNTNLQDFQSSFYVYYNYDIENTVDRHIETYQGILKCNKEIENLSSKYYFVGRHFSCPDRIEVDKIRWMMMKYVEINHVDATNRAKNGSSFLGRNLASLTNQSETKGPWALAASI